MYFRPPHLLDCACMTLTFTMSNVKDLTEQFREAVRKSAVHEGFDDIFVLMHGKDYAARFRSTEKDRDSIEHEVGLFVKTCQDRIEVLKNSLVAENGKRTQGWLSGISRRPLNADLNAHQHGMVLILSERLHAVTTQFDQLRAGRFQEAIDKRIPKRRRGLEALKSTLQSTEALAQIPPLDDRQSVPDNFQSQSFTAQELLDQETRTLQVELTNLLDTVEETERKVLEVSALNHLFSTHVLHQAGQIEKLYQQALDSTLNLEKGNKELSKAIGRNSSNRLYIIFVFLVLTLALLFLDWYE